MKPYTDEDARTVFEDTVQRVLNDELRGIVVCFTEEGTIDYASDVSVTQVRDAFLGYAREIAAYPGD